MTISELVTHSGGFHADELLSSAVLTRLHPEARLIRSRDAARSATFLAEILGLPAPGTFGPFRVVELANGVSLDFIDAGDHDTALQHYAFLIEGSEFDAIFERQVEAHGREGDLLLAISTSGNSPNVLRAIDAAKARGIHTVGLLGKGGGAALERVDTAIVVPVATSSDRIQELHIKVLHTVIEAVERRLFPENYGA